MVALFTLSACSFETPSPDEAAPALSTDESTLLASAPTDALVAPGDYDGDGCDDIAVKGSNGIWYIDYCANGLGGGWDAAYPNYGNNTAIPVPADYDGDGKLDLAVKDAAGMWGIDYASNGFGFFDLQVYGYGDANSIPVPADYDGDGKADLSIKSSGGLWAIDYAYDGFNGWNDTHPGFAYGDATWVPVPGFYSGNGHCSVTTTQACSLDTQCPTSQRCIRAADFAVKTATGAWLIDKSTDSFGKACDGTCTCVNGPNSGPRCQWDLQLAGYGDSTYVPAPADYDHDGYTDIGTKDGNGAWRIDFAGKVSNVACTSTKPCFSGIEKTYANGYGGAWAKPVPGNYTNDGVSDLDLAIQETTSGATRIDAAADGFGAWGPQYDNVNRPHVPDPSAPYITDTQLIGPSGAVVAPTNGRYLLTIGTHYTVKVSIDPGSGLYTSVFVQADVPFFHTPDYFNLENATPPSVNAIPTATHRWFSVTCSQPGVGMLGFEMRDGQTQVVFNRDYGIVAQCVPPPGHPTGLHGVVTARGCSGATCGTGLNGACGVQPSTDGHYIPGCVLQGATVQVSGVGTTTTAADGSWNMPSVTGGPLQVTVTCTSGSCFTPSCSGTPGTRSPAIAVNVTVPPGSGIEVDTALEEQFFTGSALTYTTYIDFSRGRTVLHTVTANISSTTLKTQQNPSHVTLVHLGTATGASALMNGGYFDTGGTYGGNAVGYYYSGGAASGCAGYSSLGHCSGSGAACYVDPVNVFYTGAQPPQIPPVLGECPSGQTCTATQAAEVITLGSIPMLTIQGTHAAQTANILDVDGNFWTSSQYTRVGSPACPLYDLNHDNVSDVDYAIQAADGPAIVQGGLAMIGYAAGEVAWAKTAIGVGNAGHAAYLVVADGEGVNGGHGATWYQMSQFFANVLHVTSAIKMDGGLSSSLVLKGTRFGGVRHVNTLTGEDHTWDVNPFTDPPGIIESDNCNGSVANYFSLTP